MIFGRWKGATDMVNKLIKEAADMPKRVEAALYQEAQVIMTESKRRCPIAPDGGDLRASGHVEEPVREGRKIVVTMAYGGTAIPYAIAVHEHLSIHSPRTWVISEETAGHTGVKWSEPGTGPKFLESPLNEAQPQMAARIANRLKAMQEDDKK